MTCRTFHTLLAAEETVLSGRARTWVTMHLLEPHAQRCDRCRTHLRCRERVNERVRSALLGGALAEVLAAQPAPPSTAVHGAPVWRWPVLAASATVVVAALLALQNRQPESRRRTPTPPSLVLVPPGSGELPRTRETQPSRESQGPTLPLSHLTRKRERSLERRNRTASRPSQQPYKVPAAAGAMPTPDEVYLDGRDPGRMAEWMTGDRQDQQALAWFEQQLPPIQDDFVQIPLPRLASGDLKSPAAREAVQKYEKEAAVVDSRLFKKVSLELKARALQELCAELERLTAVRLRPSRGVMDEKVTVFVKERPARDVMRQVARLFGYAWARSGEPGAYRYEMVQDLKSQLAEEEMRSRDFHEALLALDRSMEVYRPHLGLSPAELRTRAEQAPEKDQKPFRDLFFKWGAVQLYQRLTPAHFAALRQQQRLRFEMEGSQPQPNAGGHVEHSLPAEWRGPLLESLGVGESKIGSTRVLGLVHPDNAATASPWLGLEIKQSELGQVTLELEQGVTLEGGAGLARHWTIAKGQSPSTARPDNASDNAMLKAQPAFTRRVTIRPRPSCPRFRNAEGASTPEERSGMAPDELLDRPHVSSADVWEAVHRATGMPIVADAYSRLHPVPRVTVENEPLFDGLCKLGDELRLRWKKDGDFLLARSTSYFWDKLKEVPNRHLERWAEIRREKGVLPLDTLLEIVALSDRQLDSTDVGRSAAHCYHLTEWGLFGAGQPRFGYTTAAFARSYYRLLALLTPDQRRMALQPGGLPYSALTQAQQAEVARTQAGLVGLTLHAAYVPDGWYTWEARLRKGSDDGVYRNLPVVSEPTAERALASARRVYPQAQPDQIRKSAGVLAVWYSGGDGARGFGVGRPPVVFAVE